VRDQSLYIRDIIATIESIEAFIVDMDCQSFLHDDKTQSAVIRKLEIIGEAVKQLPTEFLENYPHIPWKQIAGLRDESIDFYLGMDPELIWRTIRTRLPELKKTLQSIQCQDCPVKKLQPLN